MEKCLFINILQECKMRHTTNKINIFIIHNNIEILRKLANEEKSSFRFSN